MSKISWQWPGLGMLHLGSPPALQQVRDGVSEAAVPSQLKGISSDSIC